MSEFAVQAEGLTKFYGSQRGLEDLTLEVPAGEVATAPAVDGDALVEPVAEELALAEPDADGLAEADSTGPDSDGDGDGQWLFDGDGVGLGPVAGQVWVMLK